MPRDPIRLVRMVNEVSAGGRAKPPGSGNDGSLNPFQAESCGHPAAATSFTDPGKLDGVWPVSGATVLAVDLLHRSAQGGWGRRGTLAQRRARERHHQAGLFGVGIWDCPSGVVPAAGEDGESAVVPVGEMPRPR